MPNPLIYYSPRSAGTVEASQLNGVPLFAQMFKVFKRNVAFVDRTETIRLPLNVKPLFPLPPYRRSTRNFEDICDERARELLRSAESLGFSLYVFWSGGIDSTLVLVSLLKVATPAQKNIIVVLLSEESIIEYPDFYRHHILGKLRTASAMSFTYLLGGRNIIVNGELSDQLFGSDMVARLIVKFGTQAIHQPYSRDVFFKFFNDNNDNVKVTNFYLDMFEVLMAAAPVPIESNFLYLWWLNFTLKWQSVFMRMLSYTAARQLAKVDARYVAECYAPFYANDDFQLWSLNNLDKRIGKDWQSYKWVCKDIIYDYTKDTGYRDNKTKRGSLFFLILQQQVHGFIDSSLKFSQSIDWMECYNENNDFHGRDHLCT